MRNVRKLVLWCLLGLLCVAGLGCNTVEGMGRDLDRAGEAIQDVFD